jgi:hypothetical protein
MPRCCPSLGVQFTTNGAFNGTVYIDSVNF